MPTTIVLYIQKSTYLSAATIDDIILKCSKEKRKNISTHFMPEKGRVAKFGKSPARRYMHVEACRHCDHVILFPPQGTYRHGRRGFLRPLKTFSSFATVLQAFNWTMFVYNSFLRTVLCKHNDRQVLLLITIYFIEASLKKNYSFVQKKHFSTKWRRTEK